MQQFNHIRGWGGSDPLVTANMGKNAVSAHFGSHRRAQRSSQAFICAGRQIRMKEGGGTESDDRVWQVQKYGPFYY